MASSLGMSREWLSILRTTFTVLVLIVALPCAVYADELRKYEMPGDACGSIIEFGDQFEVVSKMESGTYIPNTDCTITFKTRDFERWYIRVVHFNIEFSPKCRDDNLWIYNIDEKANQQDMKDNVVEVDYGLCGTSKSMPNYYYTRNNSVQIRWVTNGANSEQFTGFGLVVTPFTEYKEEEYCYGFRCKLTKKCISEDAFCNKIYQCEDASDEPTGCTPNTATKSAFISSIFLHTAWIVALRIRQLISDPDVSH